jgi:fibronectin type 3 domain-containing protein
MAFQPVITTKSTTTKKKGANIKYRKIIFLVTVFTLGFTLNTCSLWSIFDSDSDSSSASNSGLDSNPNSGSDSNPNSGSNTDSNNGPVSSGITVTPSTVTLAREGIQQFSVDKWWGAWSLEGAAGSSTIDSSGLLTIGPDETATTLTVKNFFSYFLYYGTAIVTVAAPNETPQKLKASKLGPDSVQLSWQAVSDVEQYTVSRSTNGSSFGQIGTVSGTSYTDNTVSAGISYYYQITAKEVNSNFNFIFAGDYFNMPAFSQKKLIPLNVSGVHYYRFPVNLGDKFTIEWQNGNNQENSSIRVDAYQNNGLSIFSDQTNGYSNPRLISATTSGFVTVRVRNNANSVQDYQLYCYEITEAEDTGTVPLPPYKVSSFRATPSPTTINLSWDAVPDAVKYNIYRSNTQTASPSRIGESTGTSYTDNYVSEGVSYWYTIAAVNANGLEGSWFQGAFSFAVSHYTLQNYTDAQIFSLAAGGTHYYRLAVTQGMSYTIEWQNGSNQENNNIRVDAYQNNGTPIFTDQANGYSSPKIISTNASGFVTVRVRNISSSSQNYQILYY